jgi:serine/threonine protein phosphatase PrpC
MKHSAETAPARSRRSPSPRAHVTFGANTHSGLERSENQDVYIAERIDRFVLLGVIDGVGGHAGGDVAAELAKAKISNRLKRLTASPDVLLREAVTLANNAIFEERKRQPHLSGMACVLTLVLIDAQGGQLWGSHVGDTRLYHSRRGELTKLTRDHSFVGTREDQGRLSEKEAMQHPRRSEIFCDVGSAWHDPADDEWTDQFNQTIAIGDRLVVCSDGLTDMVTTDVVKEHLLRRHEPDDTVAQLIEKALEAGGRDNVTIVVAHVNRHE